MPLEILNHYPMSPSFCPAPQTFLVLNYNPRGKDTQRFNLINVALSRAPLSHSPQNALLFYLVE